MAKSGRRGTQIRLQDARQDRLQRVTKGKRVQMKFTGKSVFKCMACNKEVKIRWATLKRMGDETPKCRDCQCKLVLQTACLNRGMIPMVKI